MRAGCIHELWQKMSEPEAPLVSKGSRSELVSSCDRRTGFGPLVYFGFGVMLSSQDRYSHKDIERGEAAIEREQLESDTARMDN